LFVKCIIPGKPQKNGIFWQQRGAGQKETA
jgi:hypothetical protein